MVVKNSFCGIMLPMKYKHLFFDMDQTIAPARQPILQDMFDTLSNASQDIIIVSGQEVDKIKWQSKNLNAIILGQNGNHGVARDGSELWNQKLTQDEQNEILAHIDALIGLLPETPNPEYNPIENRGAQITFSPIGNTAPVEIKMTYDPDRSKRNTLLEQMPFESENLVVKIGGSTSLDYIHKDRHKGSNVAQLIEHMGWNKDECVYFGDGLFPGGNDEAVIGVIDTVPVDDHIDCYKKLSSLLES